MNAVNEWIEALEYYPQSRIGFYLHDHTGYDVLGAACMAYQTCIGGLDVQRVTLGGGRWYDVIQGECYVLPNLVRDWLGLRTPYCSMVYHCEHITLSYLEYHRKYRFSNLIRVIRMRPTDMFI